MTKIALLSDVHALVKQPIGRLDDAPAAQLEKLKFVFDYARENGIKRILQAGDLLDKARDWDILQKMWNFLKENQDIQLMCVFGQHDTHKYNYAIRLLTALGFLDLIGMLKIIPNKPIYPEPGLSITGVSYGQTVPEDIEDVGNVQILVIHADIGATPLYPDHSPKDPLAFLKEHSQYDVILCGDNHRRFWIKDGGRHIINTGSMLRREADEYNFIHKPGFFVYDTDNIEMEWVEIPHKPANEVLSREHLDKKRENTKRMKEFTERVKERIAALNSGARTSARYEDQILKLFETETVDEEVKTEITSVMMEVDNG